MLSIGMFLIAAAAVITLVHGAGKCPLWPAVLLLAIERLLSYGLR
jgi:hypothetical protein